MQVCEKVLQGCGSTHLDLTRYGSPGTQRATDRTGWVLVSKGPALPSAQEREKIFGDFPSTEKGSGPIQFRLSTAGKHL